MAQQTQTQQTHYRVYLAGAAVTACGRQVYPVAKVQAAQRARPFDWPLVATSGTLPAGGPACGVATACTTDGRTTGSRVAGRYAPPTRPWVGGALGLTTTTAR